jgi:hypothetical protein
MSLKAPLRDDAALFTFRIAGFSQLHLRVQSPEQISRRFRDETSRVSALLSRISNDPHFSFLSVGFRCHFSISFQRNMERQLLEGK